MSRKLATVRKISKILPIEDADLIELAFIDGWQCVVKKGEFKEGDLGMYFEIDSFLDISKEPFKFLEKSAKEWNGIRGAIIRTMKLKKQLSQGLLLPLSYFQEVTHKNILGVSFGQFSENDLLRMDFTKALGVLKYEKEEVVEDKKGSNWLHRFLLKYVPRSIRLKIFFCINLFLPQKKRWKNERISTFPSFIPKTDEERIQNIFNKVKGVHSGKYIPTLKLDGSSTTYYTYRGEFGLCSRNIKLGIEDGSNFSKVAKKYSIPEAMLSLNRNIAIQGELMGPGIQGNKEKLEDHDFYVFKVWDIEARRYLDFEERKDFLNLLFLMDERCDLKHVPTYPIISTDDFPTVESFLELAEGKSIVNPIREGLVFDKEDGSFSFKAISNSFLLKNKE